MRLDSDDQNLIDNIEEHGFFSMGVFGDDQGPSFRYSVGFWETLNAPEIIVFGLDLTVMHNMLWAVFKDVRSGRQLVDGAVWTDLIEGHECTLRPVHSTQVGEYLCSAQWYSEYRGVPASRLQALQIFWPGKGTGLYPWDAGCSEVVRKHQPALYLPREVGLA